MAPKKAFIVGFYLMLKKPFIEFFNSQGNSVYVFPENGL